MKVSNKRAFTFIELLITLTVVGICFLPLLNMFSTALEQSFIAGELTTARYLAQEGMEKIKNYNFTVEQLKIQGDVWEPPLNEEALKIDKNSWRIFRKINKQSEPLEVYIQIFKDEDLKADKNAKPIVELATLFEDYEWQ